MNKLSRAGRCMASRYGEVVDCDSRVKCEIGQPADQNDVPREDAVVVGGSVRRGRVDLGTPTAGVS